MLATVNISKGFATWKAMADSLNPEMEKVGVSMVWAGTNPEETQVFMVVEMQDPEQMKTFGEREDIAKARAEAGADVASTTVISPIGEHWIP
ncbi:MAG: hypothetical protein CMH41_09010 [Micrococcales bacterium]|nr:hypothetical protein [Micrococcales bacterium]